MYNYAGRVVCSVRGKMVPGQNGSRKNDPRDKWSPEEWSRINVRRKIGHRKIGPRKNGPWKNSPRKIGLRKNVLQKLFSVKRMLGNLNDFFYFCRWILLHTQKDVWRLRHDPTYAPNCRTLKESRKVCCRVLGFHRLIKSEYSTHTHTHTTMLDAHPTIFRFWVSRGPIFRGPFFQGPIFRDHFFRDHFFRG